MKKKEKADSKTIARRYHHLPVRKRTLVSDVDPTYHVDKQLVLKASHVLLLCRLLRVFPAVL